MGLTTTDYLSKQEIKSLASKLLDESDCLKLPINIENIIQYLDLDIILIDFDDDVECFLQMDFKHIIINENKFCSEKYQKRLRFSLAHEVGHFILHRSLIGFWNIDSIERSYSFFDTLGEYQYSVIEKQADSFAAELLVPDDLLKKEYKLLHKEFPTAKQGFFVTELSKVFDVSETVIKIKLENLNCR